MIYLEDLFALGELVRNHPGEMKVPGMRYSFEKIFLTAGPINGARTMNIVRSIIARVKGLSHKKRNDPSYMVRDRLKLSSINPPRMNPSNSGAIG